MKKLSVIITLFLSIATVYGLTAADPAQRRKEFDQRTMGLMNEYQNTINHLRDEIEELEKQPETTAQQQQEIRTKKAQLRFYQVGLQRLEQEIFEPY